MPKKQTTPSSTGETLTPRIIWLQWHGDAPEIDDGLVSEDAVTWAKHSVFPRDVEYIRADIAKEQLTASLRREDEAREKHKAELAALRPMSREEMQAQLDKANYGDKLTEQMRTHLGCEVSHDMRCDVDGDSLNRVRWNSRAIILLFCALYDQEEAAKEEREHAERLASFVRASLEHLEYMHERIPAHLGSESTPDMIYELTAALQSHEARKQQAKML